MTGNATSPKTPQSNSQIPAPDTVPVPRSTSQIPYRTGDLGLGREAVLQDLERYLEVPYGILVHSLFGPSPDIAQIREGLLDDQVLVSAANNVPQWTQFPVTPDASRNAEDVVFEPLVDIVSKIFKRVSPCAVTCSAAPFVTPLSQRKNTSRPDAYITYKRPGSDSTHNSDKTHWWDIAIPFEFKKKNDSKTRDDNLRKIIWSLHNIMREDPLRRFALGITIEDTSMRIWCHNRAFLAVSTSRDFMTAINDVISLFYSIACKDEEQLGWDPTIERILDESGTVQYKFIAGGEIFTTTREIATYGADPMVSRGSRVYEVKDKNGNIFALKDSWRDSDRDTEGAILQNIFEDIGKEFGEDEVPKAKEHFVQIRISENVSVSGKPDKTLMVKVKEALKWVRTPEPVLSQNLHLPSTGHIPDSTPKLARHRLGSDNRVPQRIHTRAVFKEVGEALMNVKNLSDCFVCLSGAVEALYYLHRAGWVHRDFSPSNVLWFPGQRIGKLSDFEYAKRVDSEGTHDIRTGTMQFMAVEVENHEYLFTPRPACPNFGESPIVDIPFRAVFLHDFESEWWTATWMLFYHTDVTTPTKNIRAQLQYFELAFPSTVASGTRQNFFTTNRIRRKAWDTLSETWKDRCMPVGALADHLYRFYTRMEESFPKLLVEKEFITEVYQKVRDIHTLVVENLQGTDILLEPICQAQRKRDRSDGSPTNEAKRPRLA